MKKLLTNSFLLISLLGIAQNDLDWKRNGIIITPDVLFGKTMPANEGFPDTDLQKQFVLSLGRSNQNNPQEWAYRLKRPRTGISMGVTDFGKSDTLGLAVTVMPFIEFKAFGSDFFKVYSGMGASYFTKKFHPEKNPLNNAVTTDLTWAFRLYLYYQFLSTQHFDWRAGLGYSHHSNGHMRLMNIGYNSFLLSLSADIKNLGEHENLQDETIPKKTSYSYFAIRAGLGQNTLALAFNDKKNVYSVAGEYGRVYNNTFKVGIGLYYRLYQHYYDYINGNESLVKDGREFESFKKHPFYNASNLGLSLHGEIFLNHVGIDLQVGFNFYKPAYKIDYRINEGWENTPREIPWDWVLGPLDSKFKIKQLISSRIGLKYYIIGMEKSPKNNVYLGAHINANLGQADFSELSLGYVHSFNFSERQFGYSDRSER